MKHEKEQLNRFNLPISFRPILWSYDFSLVDPKKQFKTIIINAINYGSLDHWKWIIGYYGREEIKNVLQEIPATEIKPRTQKLAGLIFSINNFNYVPRRISRKG